MYVLNEIKCLIKISDRPWCCHDGAMILIFNFFFFYYSRDFSHNWSICRVNTAAIIENQIFKSQTRVHMFNACSSRILSNKTLNLLICEWITFIYKWWEMYTKYLIWIIYLPRPILLYSIFHLWWYCFGVFHSAR